jgi:hypothetical protein
MDNVCLDREATAELNWVLPPRRSVFVQDSGGTVMWEQMPNAFRSVVTRSLNALLSNIDTGVWGVLCVSCVLRYEETKKVMFIDYV